VIDAVNEITNLELLSERTSPIQSNVKIKLRWEVIVRFVDIGGNVQHHCLKTIFYMQVKIGRPDRRHYKWYSAGELLVPESKTPPTRSSHCFDADMVYYVYYEKRAKTMMLYISTYIAISRRETASVAEKLSSTVSLILHV
jgi:hypothetical protein